MIVTSSVKLCWAVGLFEFLFFVIIFLQNLKSCISWICLFKVFCFFNWILYTKMTILWYFWLFLVLYPNYCTEPTECNTEFSVKSSNCLPVAAHCMLVQAPGLPFLLVIPLNDKQIRSSPWSSPSPAFLWTVPEAWKAHQLLCDFKSLSQHWAHALFELTEDNLF